MASDKEFFALIDRIDAFCRTIIGRNPRSYDEAVEQAYREAEQLEPYYPGE